MLAGIQGQRMLRTQAVRFYCGCSPPAAMPCGACVNTSCKMGILNTINDRRLSGVAEKVYGYVRVSSRDQNEERQMIAMRQFGVESRNIYVDKQSGRDFNRPSYRRMLARLGEGDTMVVKSIDRLGRNYDDILEQWRCITKEKKAAIVVLDMSLLNTRQNRSLTGTLIADIVLQLLSYVAQTEREFIHQRQAEGIAAAQARGVRFGHPCKEKPAAFDACLQA